MSHFNWVAFWAGPIGVLYAVFVWVRQWDPFSVLLLGTKPRITFCTDNVRRIAGSEPHISFQLVVLCSSSDRIDFDAEFKNRFSIACLDGYVLEPTSAPSGVSLTSANSWQEIVATLEEEFNIDKPVTIGFRVKKRDGVRFRPIHKLPIRVTVIGGPTKRDNMTYGAPLGFLKPFYAACVAALSGLFLLIIIIVISLTIYFPDDESIQLTAMISAALGFAAITSIPHIIQRYVRTSRSIQYLESCDD